MIGGGGWTYNVLTDPERIRSMACDYLQRFVRGRIGVRAASFSWLEGIRLYDVTIDDVVSDEIGSDGGRRAPTSRLFQCPEVELTHDPVAILLGRLHIRSIFAYRPHCSIVRSGPDGKTNLSRVLLPGDLAPTGTPLDLPTIELSYARLSVVQQDDAGERTLEDLVLNIRGRPSPGGSLGYDIVWQDLESDASGHSLIDLREGTLRNVTGGLPWMSIEAVMVVVDANFDGAGSWCDLLGLGGRVRAIDYDVSSDLDAGAGPSATIELNNATISIPISEEEEPLDSDQRYLRFTEVDGMIKVTRVGLRADFAGRFHGASCYVRATLRGVVEEIGSLDDVDFEAELSLTGLELPVSDPDSRSPESRFIARWPQLGRFYDEYEPGGWVDLRMSVSKESGFDRPVALDYAHVSVLGGNVCYGRFPYPEEALSGLVEVTAAGIYIHDLTGNHKDGTVTINGFLARSAGRSAAELHFHGTSIPLDDALYNALGARSRRTWDLFEPSGEADVDVTLTGREVGEAERDKWRTRVAVGFDDLSATYSGFAYPLEHIGGRLLIEPSRTEVEVFGRHNDATVKVSGHLEYDRSGIRDVTLSIDGKNISLDTKLLSELPPSVGETVSSFNPIGTFDTMIRLGWDPSAEAIRPEGEILLKNVAIRHDDFPVSIDNLTGTVAFTPTRVTFDEVRGRYGEASVSVSGSHSAGEDGAGTDVMIRCENLLLDDELCSSLPGRLGEVLTEWRISGPIRTETTIKSDPDADPHELLVTTSAYLEGVDIRHSRLPAVLEDVSARLTTDRAGVRCPQMTGRYAGAQVSAAFDVVDTEEGRDGTALLRFTGLSLDSSIRDALPEDARKSWDRLAPEGTVDMDLCRLTYHRAKERSSPIWRIEGNGDLRGVGMSGLCNLEHVDGRFSIAGTLIDRLGGTTLDGQLELRTADVFGRSLSEVYTSWSCVLTARGDGEFSLDDLRGRLCDGSVAGRVKVRLDSGKTTFDVNATGRGIDIEPFLRPDTVGQDEETRGVGARGRADARLSLTGTAGDSRSLRGTGGLEIVDGRIYRLPVILAILNFINPATPPDPEAFDYVKALFSITGNRLDLTDVLFRGPALRLKGSGSMSLPDCHLDLHLVSEGTWPKIPVVSAVIEGVARGLIELHVVGPLSQPSVKTRTLPKVNDALKELFQRKKDAKNR